jgi:hypothetical protein
MRSTKRSFLNLLCCSSGRREGIGLLGEREVERERKREAQEQQSAIETDLRQDFTRRVRARYVAISLSVCVCCVVASMLPPLGYVERQVVMCA